MRHLLPYTGLGPFQALKVKSKLVHMGGGGGGGGCMLS